MDEKETMHIKEMTTFQKEVVEALRLMGYSYAFNKLYLKSGGGHCIDISKIETVADLMIEFFKAGMIEKVWQIKSALEIP